MKNKYEIRGDVTAIFLTHKGKTVETLISTDTLEKAQMFPGTWSARKERNNNSLYAFAVKRIGGGKQKSIQFTRWLLNVEGALCVDHINHDTLDNRLENLRVITNAQNQQNRKSAMKNSTNGVRGVYWEKRINKWAVRVTVNRKAKIVGYYEDINDAEKAAYEARSQLMPFSREAINGPIDTGMINKKNPDKVIGVCWIKKEKKWKAYFRRKHLGYFETLDDAIKARLAELEKQKAALQP